MTHNMYTAGDISPNFPGAQQAIFLRFAPGPRYTQQVLYVTNHHKIVGIQQGLKLQNVTEGEMLKPTV